LCHVWFRFPVKNHLVRCGCVKWYMPFCPPCLWYCTCLFNSKIQDNSAIIHLSYWHFTIVVILGVLYRDAGSITLAIQAYERCLQIDPDSRNAGQVLLSGLDNAHWNLFWVCSML
jgi:tetratricopeptide (TPR) repeat protein